MVVDGRICGQTTSVPIPVGLSVEPPIIYLLLSGLTANRRMSLKTAKSNFIYTRYVNHEEISRHTIFSSRNDPIVNHSSLLKPVRNGRFPYRENHRLFCFNRAVYDSPALCVTFIHVAGLKLF